MKTANRFLCVVLVLCLCLSLLPNVATPAEAASTGLSLSQLRQKFPHGKYWNGGNADSYTSSPCNHHGSCSYSGSCGCNSFLGLSIQCMGYAEKLGYDATGYNPRNNANGWYTNTSPSALDNLKPGDIVRYKNGGHSIYVTGVNGDTVTYTDCNSDNHCIIRWDATISKSTLRSSFSYVRSAPSSVTPGPTSCSCSTSYAGTYICTTSSLNLTIRSGHGSSYSAIGSIPPGATVTVSKASGTSSNDWAHVTYNGVTGYASMQYLSKKQATQQRDSRIGLWLSDSEMGGSISTIRTGEWLYLCYKLYDANTGDLLDSYNTNGGYTAKLTLYETNGAVAHTYTYTNDNNWISIRRNTPGKYKGELVFTWNSSGTTTSTVSINMVYEPRVTPSASDIQLNVTGTNSQTISISYSGATSSNSIYLDCTTSGDCFSYKWGSWSDHKMPLTITGVRAGEGIITIEMYDSDTDQIIATSKVYVTVTAPTYTVFYNANGGSGAPSSQTKYYNTTLTLRSTKPERTGYTFLGWATSSTATSAAYQPGGDFNIDKTTTLYAVWKKGCEGGNHKYVYNVTGKPTSTSTGKVVGECGYCGATRSALLPKLNTTDYTYRVEKAATCTAAGVGRYTWNTTTYGGSYYFDETIPATGHSYSYKVTTAPTASATGTLTGTCSKCSGTTTVTLPKLNTTDYSYSIKTAATCTASGTGRYTWKTTTYGSFYFDASIAAAGHKYSNGSCAYCGAKDPNDVTDQDTPMIIVDTVNGRAGETVTVTVSMKNNPGFGGMAYDIKYDSASLELVSYEIGLGNGICTDSGVGTYTNKVNLQYAGTSNITGDGALVTLTFKIKDSAPEGTALISVAPEDGTFFTYDGRNEKDFQVSCVNGGIKVVKYISGDINGDGKVNNRDAARLLQKLAGWDVDYMEATLDVNGDGKVNNRDAARILQYLAGWDVELH